VLPVEQAACARFGHYALVTSWRDSASEQAQIDVDSLLNAALPFAQQMLDQHGEFFPYGVAIDASGETHMAAGYTGEERPPSQSVLDILVQGYRKQRDGLRAVALVADVRADGSDAIQVEIEHREGQAIFLLMPYKKRRLKRGVDYGDLTAGAARPQIWNA
jgi:hypothetical protein